jgi:hypothetical protein
MTAPPSNPSSAPSWLRSPIVRTLGSLKLAVLSILLLAAVLAVATALESMYGMRAAYVLVYGRFWFSATLALLGVNVLCAVLVRYPWKRRQTGFVVTHLGILMILAGSWVTQRYGVDGNLPVLEGTANGEVILPALTLRVLEAGDTKAHEVVVPESATRRSGEILAMRFNGRERLVVDEFLPRAIAEREFVPSPFEGIGAPAIRVKLFNERFDVEEWLAATDPAKPALVQVGPATLTLRRLRTEKEEREFLAATPSAKRKAPRSDRRGTLVLTRNGREFRFTVGEVLGRWQKLEDSLEVRGTRFLPYAIVENNRLVSKSNELANPALEVELRDAAGNRERHTVFANFPEFATLHQKGRAPQQPTLGVQVRLLPADGGDPEDEPPSLRSGPRGRLDFAVSARGDRLFYRLWKGAATAPTGSGEVVVGEPAATGWMDLRFQVNRFLASAVAEERPRYVHFISSGGGDNNYQAAVHAYLERDGKRVLGSELWIVEGSTRQVPVGGRNVYVNFGKKRITLPFALRLDRFHIGTDPGTRKAASYESMVTVQDKGISVGDSTKISMNEPLHYGGYTFYQASYSLEAGRPPVSVFSVNFDPGRWIKYLGSLILVLGISLMFYMNPQYWDKILGRQMPKGGTT